jgi:hypothetical protein
MFTPEFASPIANWTTVAKRIRDWRREPDTSGANDFDFAKWGDIGLSPHPEPSLLGYGERALGCPSQVFSSLTVSDPAQSKSTQPFEQWRKMIERLKPYSVRGQVAGVHTYVNQMNGHASDVASLALAKPWTSVLNCTSWPGSETDTALAKYVSLRLLGFNADRLRLVLADKRHPAHDDVVLAVFFGGKAFVLNDSDSITTDDRLPGFYPSCSINARQFYLHWDQGKNDSPARAAKRLLNQFGLAAA